MAELDYIGIRRRRPNVIGTIANMAEKENVIIDIHIGPDGAMTVTVDGKIGKGFISIDSHLSEVDILGAVKDTIRRMNNET